MTRKLLVLTLLASCFAGAQIIKPNSGARISGTFTANCIPKAVTAVTLRCAAMTDNGTTITATEPLALPDIPGGAGTTSLRGSNSATGVYLNGVIVGLTSAGVGFVTVQNTAAAGVATGSGSAFCFTSSTTIGAAACDTFIKRRNTGNIQFGTADLNGAPVAQTISVQNAITGTDLPGAVFSLAGSLGTGAALPLPVVIQGADASVATGTTAQTAINRLVVADTKNLTTATPATLLSIPLATLQTAGGLLSIHMEATDGTNQCTLDDLVTFAAENSAGVFVVNTSKMGTGATACTATKSLTATYAVTGANPALLQVTPTLTGITATRFTAVYTVMHGGMTNPTL